MLLHFLMMFRPGDHIIVNVRNTQLFTQH